MSDSDIEAELDEVAVKLSEARTCRGKLGELEARQWRLRSEQTFRQRRPVMTADETSQSEKRRMLAEDRRMRTYHAVAQGSIDDDRGGRFSVMERPSVTGSSPVGYPKLPSGPWSEVRGQQSHHSASISTQWKLLASRMNEAGYGAS